MSVIIGMDPHKRSDQAQGQDNCRTRLAAPWKRPRRPRHRKTFCVSMQDVGTSP